MNINSLTSAERETLMFECLMMLRKSIPNITRTSGVLINQNQPISIEEKGKAYSVTIYLRAVDYASRYLFLGPFYLDAKKEADNSWVVSEPRFDPGVDGCYYDVVGVKGSHLKIYSNMVTVDETPVYFADCENVSFKDAESGDGFLKFNLNDGKEVVFNWNKMTQNTAFMQESLLRMCELLIGKAKDEAVKAQEEAARREARQARQGGFARPAASAQFHAFESPARTAPSPAPTRPGSGAAAGGRTIPQRPPVKRPPRNQIVQRPAENPYTPEDIPEVDLSTEGKSAFVPLKNVTPDMEKPKPFEGPGITDAYIGEWGGDEPAAAPAEENPGVRPMTAESLSHLDDWKPARSVVSSPEQEVEKYKRLLSIGAITKEEFELKKKQLLGG